MNPVFILRFINVTQKLFGEIKYITSALPLEIYFQPYNLMQSYIIEKKKLSANFLFPSGVAIENTQKIY